MHHGIQGVTIIQKIERRYPGSTETTDGIGEDGGDSDSRRQYNEARMDGRMEGSRRR